MQGVSSALALSAYYSHREHRKAAAPSPQGQGERCSTNGPTADRQAPHKPLLLRASFWIGVVMVLNCAALAIPLAAWLLG